MFYFSTILGAEGLAGEGRPIGVFKIILNIKVDYWRVYWNLLKIPIFLIWLPISFDHAPMFCGAVAIRYVITSREIDVREGRPFLKVIFFIEYN
jgi:hypothetical protein